jgi:hypothetical protein
MDNKIICKLCKEIIDTNIQEYSSYCDNTYTCEECETYALE